MVAFPNGAATIKVALNQVDESLRETVADECIKRWGLRGMKAIEMQFAARFPKQNPSIKVSAEKYIQVILNKKRPPGDNLQLEELVGTIKNGRVL